MIIRILAVACLILALMLAIKNGRMLRVAGLTGACSVIQTATDGSQLESCRPGRLEGRPDLTRRGCTTAGTVGKAEYWRCPAPVTSSQVGR